MIYVIDIIIYILKTEDLLIHSGRGNKKNFKGTGLT